MPFQSSTSSGLVPTRTSVADRLVVIARDLALIARQCDKNKLFDDLTLDHLDKLAAHADKDARMCQDFADDPNYEIDYM